MSEMVEGGASLAWRLLATLEGGSLLLATSALLAYSARRRVAKMQRTRRPVRSVLLTNTSNLLGKELKSRLESHGCVVHSISDLAVSRARNAHSPTSGASRASGANRASEAAHRASEAAHRASEAAHRASEAAHREGETALTAALRANEVAPIASNYVDFKVDALVVVGAFSPPKAAGLQAMATLVSEDVYSNLKLLESLSMCVHRGGSVAWACAGADADACAGAGDAFDTVLQANLRHVAKVSHCDPVWVGRCCDATEAAEKLVTALLSNETQQASRFSIRHAAHKVGEYVGRWLKIVT